MTPYPWEGSNVRNVQQSTTILFNIHLDQFTTSVMRTYSFVPTVVIIFSQRSNTLIWFRGYRNYFLRISPNPSIENHTGHLCSFLFLQTERSRGECFTVPRSPDKHRVLISLEYLYISSLIKCKPSFKCHNSCLMLYFNNWYNNVIYPSPFQTDAIAKDPEIGHFVRRNPSLCKAQRNN